MCGECCQELRFSRDKSGRRVLAGGPKRSYERGPSVPVGGMDSGWLVTSPVGLGSLGPLHPCLMSWRNVFSPFRHNQATRREILSRLLTICLQPLDSIDRKTRRRRTISVEHCSGRGGRRPLQHHRRTGLRGPRAKSSRVGIGDHPATVGGAADRPDAAPPVFVRACRPREAISDRPIMATECRAIPLPADRRDDALPNEVARDVPILPSGPNGPAATGPPRDHPGNATRRIDRWPHASDTPARLVLRDVDGDRPGRCWRTSSRGSSCRNRWRPAWADPPRRPRWG